MITSTSWDKVGRTLFPLLALGCLLGFVLSQDVMLLGVLVFATALIMALPAEEPEAHQKTVFAYLLTIAGVVGVLMVAVMLFNFLMNPYGIFDHRLSTQIPPAGRDKKVELYARYDPAPPIVILGSSRSFGVQPDTVEGLTGQTTFNASVENGTPRDYLGFANYMVEQGQFPDVIVVGLAVEQVTTSSTGSVEDDSSDREDALSPYFEWYVEPTRLDTIKSTLKDISQLASFHQTQASVELLAAQIEDTLIPHHAFADDGSGRFYVHTLPEMIKSDIEGQYGDVFEQRDMLNPDQLEYLEAFLQVAQQHGARVVIYLPPYHPDLLALYQEQNFPRLRAALLDQLAAWQADYGLIIHDFTEIASFGATDLMFYDTIHATEEANDLLVGRLAPDIANP